MADLTVTASQVAPINETVPEISTMIAAVVIAKGQVVYEDANGKADLARANATGTVQKVRGVALQGVAAGRPVNVLEHGSVYGFGVSGVAHGSQVFVSGAVAGAIADTAPVTSTQFVVPIGTVRAMPEGPSGATMTKVLHIDVQTTHATYVALP